MLSILIEHCCINRAQPMKSEMSNVLKLSVHHLTVSLENKVSPRTQSLTYDAGTRPSFQQKWQMSDLTGALLHIPKHCKSAGSPCGWQTVLLTITKKNIQHIGTSASSAGVSAGDFYTFWQSKRTRGTKSVFWCFYSTHLTRDTNSAQ